MKYRKFGKLDWKGSALGFGTMRLPLTDENQAHIDEAEATRMIRYAIDHGVNYVDTAYAYHEECCESWLGRALQDGYREKVKIATKLPSWLIESSKDYDRYLNEQLKNLQVDKIDFYLLHTLKKDSWTKLRDLKVFRWAEKAMADGRIDYLGFSFHDEFDVFKEIVDAYDKKKMIHLDAKVVNADKSKIGLTGSQTEVWKIFIPERKGEHIKLSGTIEEMSRELCQKLKEDKIF